MLIVENQADHELLSVFCSKCLGQTRWQEVERRLAVCYAKGNPWKQPIGRLREQLQGMISLEGRVLQAFVIADWDYYPDRSHLETHIATDHVHWHVWERAEIENYLLCPDAIIRLLRGQSRQPVLEESAFRREYHQLLDSSYDSANDHLVEAYGDYRRLSEEKWDNVTISRKAREYLKTHWETDKVALADAKDVVLPGLKRWLQEHAFGQFSNKALAEVLLPEDLPARNPSASPRFGELRRYLHPSGRECSETIMKPLRIAIHGAAGRMGQRLIALAGGRCRAFPGRRPRLAPTSALGEDAGLDRRRRALGVPVSATLDAPVDVVLDFSVPAATEKIVEICRKKKIPIVVATTGFDEAQMKKLRAAAQEIPLLWSPSMSLAVNLAMKLAEVAARTLADRDADVEILERHHRFKEDSPSGTALKFGQIIAAAMGQTAHRHGRQGRPGKRPHGEIGYHAIRVGDNPGEHTIVFGMLGETLELTVRATNRDCYAAGALAAAKFLAGQKPGLYGMSDLLEL